MAPRAAVHEWAEAKKAERQYAIQLRKIAKQIGEFLSHLTDESDAATAEATLAKYAELITPWAKARARSMVAEIARRNDKQWRRVSTEMGQSFRALFGSQDIGARFHELMDEQVVLIKSLPIEAAERVHDLVTRGVIEGRRFTDIAPMIRQGGKVSRSRATLIARTETGRVVTALAQARAEHVDSEGYVWRTMRDASVRPSHRVMEGKFVAWADPPTLDNLTGHAGALPNCRCFVEPIIPLNL